MNPRSTQRRIPVAWRAVPLGSVCRLRRKSLNPKRYPGEEFLHYSIPAFDNDQVPCREMGGDILSQKYLVCPDDVLFSKLNPRISRVWHVKSDGINLRRVCSTEFMPLESPEYIDREWLRFFLSSSMFVHSIKRPVSAATKSRERLAPADVLDATLLVPPLPEQKRIVAVLDEQLAEVDRARAAVEEQLEAAQALPEAFLREIFDGPEAREWPRRRLGDVCSIQLGKMLSPASKTGLRSRPYLRNANVQWGRFELSDIYEMDFDEREEAKFALKPGDLLVCEGGEPGRAAVWEGQISPCYYQKALHRLRPKVDTLNPRFVMYRLWAGAIRGEFDPDSPKTTIAHLPRIRLVQLAMPLPPDREQAAMARRLDDQFARLFDLRVDLEARLDYLQLLSASLLESALSGRIED